MTTEPKQILVAAYADEQAAQAAYDNLMRLRDEGRIGIEAVACVEKGSGGRLRIKESDDTYGRKGAGIGALVGGAVGIIGGPIGIAIGAGVGALTGGLVARYRDSGLPNKPLRELGETLDLGNSAVVVVVSHRWVAEVAEMLDEVALRVTNTAVTPDMKSPLFVVEESSATAEQTAPPIVAEEIPVVDVEAESSEMTATEEVAESMTLGEASVDDLQQIDGIGPTYAQRLTDAGITNFNQLAARSPDDLAQITNARSSKTTAAWIEAARTLA